MEPLLFLAHRIPYPPNKGDKSRSYHLLRFLASRYRIHLGTFVDDSSDLQYVPKLRDYCASVNVVAIAPAVARLKSLRGLATGEPLTLAYYRDASMMRWVRSTVAAHRIAKVLVFSSAMAQFIDDLPGLRVVVDFVDVDSAKWKQYGSLRPWPLSLLFQREGQRLLEFERAVSRRTAASVFVTPNEAALFCALAPECAPRVHHAQMGVDSEFFSPDHTFPTPYGADEQPIVFTGTMDYWPNIDAASWFARDVLPLITSRRPEARFYIVGMNPPGDVQALSRERAIVVTGRVPDVRPFLQHARVVVAPLRVARGIQSKALEAMAMGRPVVVSAAAAASISGTPGRDFAAAETAPEFASRVLELMEPARGAAMGAAARQRTVKDYDWTTNLAPFEQFLCEPMRCAG
jgi:sugar transferase (PEP-CTERM/EpsH1 system associated)